MLHIDYSWDLYPDKIILDEELNTDRLGWKGGDYFKLINVNGRQMLVKISDIEKFIIKGATQSEQVSNMVGSITETDKDMVKESAYLQRKRSL